MHAHYMNACMHAHAVVIEQLHVISFHATSIQHSYIANYCVANDALATYTDIIFVCGYCSY